MADEQRRDLTYIWDMLEAARAIVRYVENMTMGQYVEDDKTQAAVERRIEIIGEAARCVSREFEAAHPEVPWQKIVAQRHVLAHEYGEIVHDRIWHVAKERIPELVQLLERILDEQP